jgi:DNA-binding IclR family transcriptional regulator
MTDAAARLLYLLALEDGISAARACKRLGLSRSELQRLLVQLGDHAELGGLDLVRVVHEDGRDKLWLSERAHAARSER